jgi:PEGA domain
MEHGCGGRGVSWRIVVGCALLWTWTAAARASTAVVVPPSVDLATSPEVVEGATSELSRLLRVHGFDVISPGQAAAAAEDAQTTNSFSREHSPLDCRTPICATEYRRLFDASFAVHLRLLGSGGKVRTVTVTITESPTASFAASSMVEGADVKGAIQAAYGAAREKHLRGEGPWLSVSGTPAGAVVYLDGQEYGTLPFERRYVDGGTHRVEIRKDGFITQSMSVEIPARVDLEQRLAVKLAPLGAAPVAERRIDRTWDYVLGAAVMAAGGVHLAMGIQQKLKEGDCSERNADGSCRLAYGTDDGLRENVLVGVGAAGVALGGILMWAAPIGRFGLKADQHSAAITLRGGF